MKHANCIEKYLSEKHGTTQDIETGFQTSTEREMTERHLETERLLRTAYLVVKEHLPFTNYTSMCKFQQLNGLELGENYLSDKVCARLSDLKSEVYRYIRDDIDSMLILLSIMTTISCSTCECTNKQKTNEKISISNDTLKNVMLISVNRPDITELDAARAVDNWVSSGKRRLESKHSTQQQKKQNIFNEM